MKEDKEGFQYPHIDDKKCINCGLCFKICPANQRDELNQIQQYWVAYNHNKTVEKNSSSGGIFPVIAKYFLDNNGYVCAAEMREGLFLEHKIISQSKDILKMQGSKYLQSDLKHCFEKIKILLQAAPVLFVGTPCQVAGLKNFLNGKDTNLYCIDLICHGVPSPGFFRRYIKEVYKSFSKEVTNIKFREKNNYEKDVYRLVFVCGEKVKRIYSTDDAYYSAFERGENLRESCYSCPFARSERIGDITLGDCADKDRHTSFGFSQVLSSVFVNTTKGAVIWEKISSDLIYEKANLACEIQLNKQLYAPVVRPEARNSFYSDFFVTSNQQFKKKYKSKLSFKKKLWRYIKSKIPLIVKARLRGYSK